LFGRSDSSSSEAHELFGMRLRADCDAELADVPPMQLWQAMLDDGRADDFLRSVAAHVVDGAPPPPSFGPSCSSGTSNGSSHRLPAARKRVPVAPTPAPAAAASAASDDERAGVDDRSALLRICGEANANVLREHGIVGLAELRGAPTAVLQDLVPNTADVDLWPQMAAALADGKSWFDVERVKASRSLRVRSPPSRLRVASPQTPLSRGKRSQPASASSASKRKKPAASASASASKSSKKKK
jgi:predicted flap endonuclease-1-like 5' DNA nuclease